MVKWSGGKKGRPPRNSAKSTGGGLTSKPSIPERKPLIKGLEFEAWIERYPSGTIATLRSRCFAHETAFLDRRLADELQRVLSIVIEALDAEV